MYTMIVKNPSNGHDLKLYIEDFNVELLTENDTYFRKLAIASFAFDITEDKIIKNRMCSNLELFENYLRVCNLI